MVVEVLIIVEEPLFELGETVFTCGARNTLVKLNIDPAELIARHVTGDWGDIPLEDQKTNQRAVKNGGRVFSSYILPLNTKIYVITESDRSYTTILLPEEY